MIEAPIRLHLEWQPEGVYVGTSPDVPGLVVEAPTRALAMEYAASMARVMYETLLELGKPVPPALQNLPPIDEAQDTTVYVDVG